MGWAQTMYKHVSKCKNDKRKNKISIANFKRVIDLNLYQNILRNSLR
jgi:hypothetical protein